MVDPRDLVIPRRLSVHDVDYGPTHGLLDVFVDGQKQSEVISYDMDLGTVVRFVRAGAVDGDTEIIRGVVTVKLVTSG
jgi:hypothetical protein